MFYSGTKDFFLVKIGKLGFKWQSLQNSFLNHSLCSIYYDRHQSLYNLGISNKTSVNARDEICWLMCSVHIRYRKYEPFHLFSPRSWCHDFVLWHRLTCGGNGVSDNKSSLWNDIPPTYDGEKSAVQRHKICGCYLEITTTNIMLLFQTGFPIWRNYKLCRGLMVMYIIC